MAKQDNAPPAGTDTQTEQAPVAVSNVIEMNIVRADANPEGGRYLYMRAAQQTEANEAWGGKVPCGFMEMVVVGGDLMGLEAGHRIRMTVEQVN